MRKQFNLTELIVVIVVLGILAAIILINITDQKSQATQASIIGAIRNIQTATDRYETKTGVCPSDKQPVIGDPQTINLSLLYPDYIRNYPKLKGVHFWVDYNCKVFGSGVDTPKVEPNSGNEIIWTPDKDSKSCDLYRKDKQGLTLVKKEATSPYTIDSNFDFFVSCEDQSGNETPPVGENHDKNPDGIPDSGNPSDSHQSCDADGYICIRTVEELDNVRNNLSAKYRVANNLDLSSIANWTPIEGFTGIFDGNNYEINNLTIDDVDGDYAALFGTSDGAQFMNIRLTNLNVKGSYETAGLVAESTSTVINNVSISGSVQGRTIVGGVVGYGTNITASNIGFNGKVSGSREIGGIGGNIDSSDFSLIKVDNLELTGDGNSLGGVIGKANSTKVNNVSVKGNVFGSKTQTYFAGGVVGNASGNSTYRNTLSDIEVDVNVQGWNSIAGVIGDSWYADLNNITGTANIDGGLYLGGMSGSLWYTNVESVKFTSYVKGSYMEGYEGNVGGLISRFRDSNVKDIELTTTVTNNSQYTAGLVGQGQDSSLSNVTLIGSVVGNDFTGGLIGSGTQVTIKNITTDNTVTGKRTNGGIAGIVVSSIFSDLNVKSTVNGTVESGGVFGYMNNSKLSNVQLNTIVNAVGGVAGGVVASSAYYSEPNTNSYLSIVGATQVSAPVLDTSQYSHITYQDKMACENNFIAYNQNNRDLSSIGTDIHISGNKPSLITCDGIEN